MCYFATKSFIHRDLAARNILVSEDGICKVCELTVNYSESPDCVNDVVLRFESDRWFWDVSRFDGWKLLHLPRRENPCEVDSPWGNYTKHNVYIYVCVFMDHFHFLNKLTVPTDQPSTLVIVNWLNYLECWCLIYYTLLLSVHCTAPLQLSAVDISTISTADVVHYNL